MWEAIVFTNEGRVIEIFNEKKDAMEWIYDFHGTYSCVLTRVEQ